MRAATRIEPGTLRGDTLVRGRFHVATDEPESVGGEDSAPAPHELVAAALSACIATTLAMYARTKAWELGEIEVEVVHHSHETPPRFEASVSLSGDLDHEQLARLEKVAASCPVGKTLQADVVLEERMAAPAHA